jgi:hypothetical protein
MADIKEIEIRIFQDKQKPKAHNAPLWAGIKFVGGDGFIKYVDHFPLTARGMSAMLKCITWLSGFSTKKCRRYTPKRIKEDC